MAVMMKQLLDRFASMEKAAQATLAAEPGALVGVESLPGSEHDAKVPADAKKPDAEVTQGQPAGATTAEGAVNGGDAKPLNERKLEVDQTLENPKQKPEITDDALTAKEAEAHLGKLVGDLLADIQAGKAQVQKQAQAAETKTEPKTEVKDGGEKTATAKNEAPKIELNDEMLSKLAAAVASFNAGRKAADDAIKQAQASSAEKQAAANVQSRAIAMVKAACIKAAQEAGLNPADAEAAAANAMATAGVPAEAIAAAPVATDAGAAPAADDTGAAGDVQLPDDVTEEELGAAIVDLVSSGELDADTAKALVDEIAGADAGAADAGVTDAGAINEDQAAEIIANGLESGEITPEQAQVIAAAIEGGAAGDAGADAGAAAADADAAAAGAADAAAAAQDASDEAKGAADAEAAIKQAAAAIRANTIQKVASHIVAKRENEKQAAAKTKQDEQKSASPLLQKVASILTARKEAIEKANAEKQAQAAVTPEQQKYLEGFCKKAAELGVDPQMLAQYMIANQSAQAK